MATEEEPKKDVHPDDLIFNAMGSCGLYQAMVIGLIVLHRAPVGFHLLAVAVMAPKPVFNCTDPAYDKCDENCPGHVFDHSIWKSTTITEFDLVCGRAIIVSVIQSLVMFGILVGSFIFGWAGDRFGRLYPLCIAVTIQLVAGVGAGLVHEIITHTFLRFLTALATGGSMIPSFALFMEFTDKKYRTIFGVALIPSPVHLAHAILGALSYWCRTWNCIQLSMSLYSVCLLSYWCLLPESTRWLLARDRTEEVIKILEKGAKCNRMPTAHIRRQVEEYVANKPKIPHVAGSFLDLCGSTKMRLKTIVMCFNWLVISMGFYAIAQYLGQIGGNIFLTLTIAGFLQIPGVVLGAFLITIIGRKWSLLSAYAIVSAPMFLVVFIPRSYQIAVQVCCCLSMAGAAMSFGLIYVYAGELFPTVIRSLGVGMCSTWARVGSMISPFIMHLEHVAIWFPPLVFAIMPLFAALATIFYLPETKGVPLPDTVEEADEL